MEPAPPPTVAQAEAVSMGLQRGMGLQEGEGVAQPLWAMELQGMVGTARGMPRVPPGTGVGKPPMGQQPVTARGRVPRAAQARTRGTATCTGVAVAAGTTRAGGRERALAGISREQGQGMGWGRGGLRVGIM